jgi:hypothetical protein
MAYRGKLNIISIKCNNASFSEAFDISNSYQRGKHMKPDKILIAKTAPGIAAELINPPARWSAPGVPNEDAAPKDDVDTAWLAIKRVAVGH